MSQSAPESSSIWLRSRGEPSLADVFRSVSVAPSSSSWRKFLTFLGPGYLVAVGYMDPGNWATSLAGGAQFGYTLLVVALVSNIMAVVLQSPEERQQCDEADQPGEGADLDRADAVDVQRLDIGDDVGPVADLVLHRLLVAQVHGSSVFPRLPRSGWVRP